MYMRTQQCDKKNLFRYHSFSWKRKTRDIAAVAVANNVCKKFIIITESNT